MKSLLKECTQKRWYPTSVEVYKGSIKIRRDTSINRRIVSNFAYSMQYIEYIEKQLDELNLSSVIQTMLYKSYIITGMGIIESLLVYRLRDTGNWNVTTWQEYGEIQSNPKQIDGYKIKATTKLLKEVAQYDMRMDLDSMIKRTEKKNLLTINHKAFPALKKLRELRNRVHLQEGSDAYDHDYNNFGIEEVQMMRKILYTILTCSEICNCSDPFSFIAKKYIEIAEEMKDSST